MNARRIIFMLLLLAAGSLYLAMTENWHRGTIEEKSHPIGHRLFSELMATNVKRIGIVHPDSRFGIYALNMNQQDPNQRTWVLTDPQGAPVDQKIANDILNTVLKLESTGQIEEMEQEPSKMVYGFVPPSLVLTVEGPLNKRVAIFGKVSVSGKRYVQVEGEHPIYLVPEASFKALYRLRDDVRDRTPFHFDKLRVVAFTVVRNTPPDLAFEKEISADTQTCGKESSPQSCGAEHSTALWSLRAGDKILKVDDDLLEAELSKLQALKVNAFVDDFNVAELPLYGLVNPKLVLRVGMLPRKKSPAQTGPSSASSPIVGSPEATPPLGEDRVGENLASPEFTLGGNPDALTILVGEGVQISAATPGEELKKVTKYFAKITGDQWLYQFDAPFYRTWLQPPDHFRDKTPFDTYDANDVAKLTVKKNVPSDVSLTYVPKTSGESLLWERESGGGANGRTIESLLNVFWNLWVLSYPAIDEDRGVKFRDLYGLAHPFVEIEITLKAKGEKLAIKIGNQVASSAGGEKEGSVEGQQPSPQYGQVTASSGESILVILSSADVADFTKLAGKLLNEGSDG